MVVVDFVVCVGEGEGGWVGGVGGGAILSRVNTASSSQKGRLVTACAALRRRPSCYCTILDLVHVGVFVRSQSQSLAQLV